MTVEGGQGLRDPSSTGILPQSSIIFVCFRGCFPSKSSFLEIHRWAVLLYWYDIMKIGFYRADQVSHFSVFGILEKHNFSADLADDLKQSTKWKRG